MDKKYYVADIGEYCAADDDVRKHLLKVFGEQCFIGCRPVDIGKCLVAVSSETFDLANFRPDEILLDVRSSSLKEIRAMEFSGDEVIRKMLARKTSKKPSINVISISGEDLLKMLLGIQDSGDDKDQQPSSIDPEKVNAIRNALGKLGESDED
jgi:hypothetical protein